MSRDGKMDPECLDIGPGERWWLLLVCLGVRDPCPTILFVPPEPFSATLRSPFDVDSVTQHGKLTCGRITYRIGHGSRKLWMQSHS